MSGWRGRPDHGSLFGLTTAPLRGFRYPAEAIAVAPISGALRPVTRPKPRRIPLGTEPERLAGSCHGTTCMALTSPG